MVESVRAACRGFDGQEVEDTIPQKSSVKRDAGPIVALRNILPTNLTSFYWRINKSRVSITHPHIQRLTLCFLEPATTRSWTLLTLTYEGIRSLI